MCLYCQLAEGDDVPEDLERLVMAANRGEAEVVIEGTVEDFLTQQKQPQRQKQIVMMQDNELRVSVSKEEMEEDEEVPEDVEEQLVVEQQALEGVHEGIDEEGDALLVMPSDAAPEAAISMLQLHAGNNLQFTE